MTRWDNAPTVVVVLVPCNGGLLLVRRALAGEGHGQLALPGGFQMRSQSWQEAGAAEIAEECGVTVDPDTLRLISVETARDVRLNVLVCEAPPVTHEGPFAHDAEVSEVVVAMEPADLAFPIHTRAVADWFARRAEVGPA